ncbi:MAG TPA: sucrase ferredoxin [Acidimicrobiales bacterium]|nr:sucrase ferredoxin [Acidimicrobiales bacterium]
MAETDVKVRCSAWAREVDLSPIGTIGSYRGYLLVETPLPWPRDVGEIPLLGPLGPRLAASGLRLQALVPSSLDAGPEQRRVVLHSFGSGDTGFDGYRRNETVAGRSLEEAVDRLIALAGGATVDPGRAGSRVTDVLVCTHGRRDVCCGSQGTDLALQLAAAGAPEDVHLWRTSHTGGHRFAPTFIVLPQGTGWAFADTALVGQVLDRSVPFADVAHHYRGCAGLAGPREQALEREVLLGTGWELLDRARTAFLTGETTADGGHVTRLEAGGDRWEAVVRPGRTLPVPDCMKPLSEAKKSETEWVVSDLRGLS